MGKFDHSLHAVIEQSVDQNPDRIALIEPSGAHCTYTDLHERMLQIRLRLAAAGLEHGERVGVYMQKSICSVVSIYAVLHAGCTYVPVDNSIPPARAALIFQDCAVAAVLCDADLKAELAAQFDAADFSTQLIVADDVTTDSRIHDQNDALSIDETEPEAAAYVLYTSGSTGRPKGVVHSHRSALAFVGWCDETFTPTSQDRFSSHAPFHFDLSILDIFLPLSAGASIVLFDSQTVKNPREIARLVAEHKISFWYSTPSALIALMTFGKIDNYELDSIKTLLFAGEVFPLAGLKQLRTVIPRAMFYNLYGPTETNVCTFLQIPETIPDDRTDPFPIGRACSHMDIRITDVSNSPVPDGERGEIIVHGASVMDQYWNNPAATDDVFCTDAAGTRWYRTGDIGIINPDGNIEFAGRLDRMVKRRGYRIELYEIEHWIQEHANVSMAAAIGVLTQNEMRITAFYCCESGAKVGEIALRSYLADYLPAYMFPDRFVRLAQLPLTSNHKTDYQQLKEMV